MALDSQEMENAAVGRTGPLFSAMSQPAAGESENTRSHESDLKLASRIERAYRFASLSSYPAKKRFLIRIIDLLFYFLISLIGRTVRIHVEGSELAESAATERVLPIYCFWHDRILLSTWFWRN